MVEAVKRLIPLFNRVLIKKADVPTQSKGGIFVPEPSRNQVSKGTVVAVGSGGINTKGEKIPCSLQVGDMVLLPDYGGTRVQQEDKQEYFLYREADVLAKIKE